MIIRFPLEVYYIYSAVHHAHVYREKSGVVHEYLVQLIMLGPICIFLTAIVQASRTRFPKNCDSPVKFFKNLLD